MTAFNATTISMAGMADFNTGEPNSDAVELTVSQVTRLSATVLRLHLEGNLATLAEELSPTDAPYFVFIDPPLAGVEGQQGQALHSGDDWRLAVFFDHAAPYIQTAEVTVGSQSIEIAFNKPVQFGIEFDEALNTVSTASAGFSPPAPEADDFLIVHRRENGSVEQFSPVEVETSQSLGGGITELTLVMPIDREYLPSETADVRIARRLKDPTHPSLASVFDFVNER